MQKKIALLLAIFSWFAVIAQFYLMIQNNVAPVSETLIRFFSYFTILTNIMVALFFTGRFLNNNISFKAGNLTAVAIYIFTVGIVYQFMLRHVWQPQGLQLVVDELLHTINPVLVVIFWYCYEQKQEVKYSQIKSWLIFPLIYFVCVMFRGNFSGFYPYPFINVQVIGWSKAMLNGGLIMLFFLLLAYLFIFVGKKTAR